MKINFKKTILVLVFAFVAIIGTVFVSNFLESKSESKAGVEKKAGPVNYWIIHFNTNGGSSVPDMGVQQATDICNELHTQVKTTRTGYVFTKWYTDKLLTSEFNCSEGIYEDTTIYAGWTPLKYSMTYNANGGSGAPSSGLKTHDESYIISSVVPLRVGYKFIGWTKSSSGSGTVYVAGNAYTTNATTTFYAKWEKITYEMKYSANGGTGAPSKETKEYDVTYTLSTTIPTRSGYTFDGWNTKSDGSGSNYQPGASYTVNATTTFYAKWTEVQVTTYTITYNANGGSGAPASGTKTQGVTYTISSTKPTRSGFTFAGWNTKSDGTGTTYQPGASYTANAAATLYAQWTAIPVVTGYGDVDLDGSVDSTDYTMLNKYVGGTYDLTEQQLLNADVNNDGSVNKIDALLLRQFVLNRHPNTLPSKPITNYILYGDVNNDGEVDNKDFVLLEEFLAGEHPNTLPNLSIAPVTYEITYNANGGFGAPSKGTKTKGQAFTLSTVVPTRSGYTFAGWNTKADGTGSTYQPGASYTIDATTTFYAKWTVVSIDIEQISMYTTRNGYLVLPEKTGNIQINSSYSYTHVKSGNNTGSYIGTGDIITVYKKDNTSVRTDYTVLVLGDISGDGRITTMDSTAVVKHIMGVRLLTGRDFLAADYYEDGNVSAMDHVKMVKYIMKED